MYDSVFIAITNVEGQNIVDPARKYQEFVYNKYFAIKTQDIFRDVPYRESKEDLEIMYIVESDKVKFNITDKNGNNYIFEIKDFTPLKI